MAGIEPYEFPEWVYNPVNHPMNFMQTERRWQNGELVHVKLKEDLWQ